MKNLLELVNNTLKIAPEALTIKEFSAIWKRDRSKSKDRALKELAYIYYTVDYQSIYRNYHPNMRLGKINQDVMQDKDWKPDQKVIDAQIKYEELQTTLSLQILKDVETGLDKLRTYFKEADFEEDEDGRAAKNFISNVKQLGDLMKGIKSLREEVEKELTDQMQLRGGSTIGSRELPPDRRG